MLRPEDIENADLPRATFRGYERESTVEFLRRVAWDVRSMIHERGVLEVEVQRLRAELATRARRAELEAAVLRPAQSVARELIETARRESDLMLKKAREHAARIESAAEEEHAARLKELRQLDAMARTVRTELPLLLRSMIEVLEAAPEGLEQPARPSELMEDLERITWPAVADRARELPAVSPELSPDKANQLAAEDTDEPDVGGVSGSRSIGDRVREITDRTWTGKPSTSPES